VLKSVASPPRYELSMSKLTIFSWGYWGWGNATQQLVQLVDSIEATRGFNAPVFVDIRISRSVRARGFNANAFGRLLGDARYRHMPLLGNLAVLGRSESRIQIKDPLNARALLELACQLTERHARLLFFCSCEYPRLESDANACHRVTVARLLREGNQASLPVDIVEWPGGEPRTLEMKVSPSIAKKILRGAKSIPLGWEVPRGDFASLAWGSIIRLCWEDMKFPVVVGPPKYGPQGWYLPVPWETTKKDITEPDLVAKAREWRREFGLEPQSAALS